MFTITENAVKQVQTLLGDEQKKRPEVKALRVGIRGGGCSGLSYFMEFTAGPEAKDQIFEQHGLQVIVDPKSLLYLKGTEIEFTSSVKASGFQFRNPNKMKGCGCGESFTV